MDVLADVDAQARDKQIQKYADTLRGYGFGEDRVRGRVIGTHFDGDADAYNAWAESSGELAKSNDIIQAALDKARLDNGANEVAAAHSVARQHFGGDIEAYDTWVKADPDHSDDTRS